MNEEIVAERGVASMARTRSLQSRMSSALALLLCAAVAVGLLAWYYGGMLSQRKAAAATRHPAPAAATDSALPPLGPVVDPRSVVVASDSGPSITPASAAAVLPLPAETPAPTPVALTAAAGGVPDAAASQALHPTALDRRLAGPAFAGAAGEVTPIGRTDAATATAADQAGALSGLLASTATPAAGATQLPSQRLLLAKGAFIDCTLETAIDSSLPGMTTCITATDTFSVDGKVVLLERGSKLIGETRGQVQQGSARLFVLWTQARTPTGVVVPLASPGTDALGRSGLDGEVDRHFWQRFGAAILISLVDGAVQAVQRSGESGTVIYDPSASSNVATEALRGSIGIAPTITKHQGDRIQILVARDLDFRQVYQLRDSELSHQQ
jgi:type IV secretion system protein VirB10